MTIFKAVDVDVAVDEVVNLVFIMTVNKPVAVLVICLDFQLTTSCLSP